ncbi:Thioredoxin [Bernardetia litoralis DSM 6794]|uniref:Thioredoxin n=1 Tax=Bernardetia litoralis (strain ATCC 23117 / DSM 6794 / NBRC 15988 / NCIMB 1366 / Fx l1 / Sio-4) TaxID=880071 RepID=I4APX6_BERLS|nr:thioredoxin fold domain-containing protein [Bernardetia litoralis]AFM06011.1 Thioredoxin [Bernardetia litoralis DSM 6794]
MKKYFLTLVALFFVTFLANAQSTETAPAKVIAVVFHADWCPYCVKLSDKIESIKADVDLSNVEFIEFDFTDKKTKKATEAFASEKNVQTVLENNQGTGFLVLIDAETKEELVKITGKDSEKTIKESFEKYVN